MTSKEDKIKQLETFIEAVGDKLIAAKLIGVSRQALQSWQSDQREMPEPVYKLLKLINAEPKLVNHLW